MAVPEAIIGHLVMSVEEANGKDKDGKFVWEGIPDAFMKVEIRGGAHNVKAQTKKALVQGDVLSWREQLVLDVLEGANELRLMLCREKVQGTRKGTAVIAACGIYVKDILDAVPIDKYFELFKPNAGGDGGYIRISMNFVKDLSELASVPAPEVASRSLAIVSHQNKSMAKKEGGGKNLLVPVVLAAVAAAAGFVFVKKHSAEKKK